MSLKWNGAVFQKLMRQSAMEGIIAAALLLHSIARKKASVVNMGKKVRFEVDDEGKRVRKKKAKKKTKTRKRRGPGNPDPALKEDELLIEPEERAGNRPPGGGSRKKRKKKKYKTRTIYPNSSEPGESPRRRTGFGQKNIVFGFDRNAEMARVGYTRLARYMTFHELGITYSKVGFQQRPTIVPALADNLGPLSRRFMKAALKHFKTNTPSGLKGGKGKP